ncbi:MAG: hypothetical protein U5J83_13035 [Bryobacterales bacterium]|nr:hypothetical protein [Bryobacterales bacterium]
MIRSQLFETNTTREFLSGREFSRWTGTVTQAVGLLIESIGPMAALGDFCEVETASGRRIRVQVVGFRDQRVLSIPLEETDGIHLGDTVVARPEAARVEVGPHLLGRVLDGFGNFLDLPGAGADEAGTASARLPEGLSAAPRQLYDLYRQPANPLDRENIRKPLATGIRVIDGLLPCGQGQRIGIFGGSGVGKSTLLGAMARHNAADVSVIALIGERNREVREFIENDLGPEGLKRSVVVVATSDRPAPLRVRACFVAMAVAEYFRDQGANVLMVMDSVTRLAMAQREIGLAAGESLPARRAIPPRSSICFPKSSNAPATFLAALSPASSPCWWKATTSTNLSATPCGPSSMAMSCYRGTLVRLATTRPSTFFAR